MATKDFNLDLVEVSKSNTGASTRITSLSFCSQACKTYKILGCNLLTHGCRFPR